MSTRRKCLADLLDATMLKRVVLVNGLPCADKRRLADLRAAVAGATALSCPQLVQSLSRESLYRLCKAQGLAASGLSKADLAAAVLRAAATGGKRVDAARRPGSERGTRRRSPTRRFVALDFETANTSRDSACALSLVICEEGRIVDTYSTLLRPPSLNFQFTYIHGITARDVSKAPRYADVHSSVMQHLDRADFIAAHNASFDRSVLGAVCRRSGLQMPELPWTCTVRLAREHWDVYPTKLPDVCRHLGIALKHHDALSDATACARIVLAAAETSLSTSRRRSA